MAQTSRTAASWSPPRSPASITAFSAPAAPATEPAAPATEPAAPATEPVAPAPEPAAPGPPAARPDPSTWQPRRSRGQPDPIVVDEASRTFADFTAVAGLSLAVPPGTILGLVGPSGSGKTTTVRMLTGALRPTSGLVRVLGEDPTRFRRATRERIGYMPQEFVLYPDLTAKQNVSFMGSLFGMLWRRRRRRVREALELVNLWDVRDRRASELSGGMRRRLELACALVHEPALLFLDEPTAGIDPILRQEIWEELRRLRENGQTLLVTTQYVAEAESCDVVALLVQGRLVALASPGELRLQALGGEVVEIETREAVDGDLLRAVPGVRTVRQRSPRDLLVITDNAGRATPEINDALASQGIDVASSREYRPPFDEVFAELVARDADAREALAEEGMSSHANGMTARSLRPPGSTEGPTGEEPAPADLRDGRDAR